MIVSTDELPDVTDAGLNEALAPDGTPEIESATDCVEPEVVAVDIVLVPLLPCPIDSEFGVALMLKSFVTGALIVKLTLVVCVALGAVPETVKAYVPAAADPLFSVRVELPPAVTEVGLNEADAPAGSPLTERFIVSALPDVTAVVTVVVPDEPALTETAEGEAAMEKSFVVVVPPQLGNLNEPIRVAQLKAPFAGMYWLVYQNVQSSDGSTAIDV